MKNGFKKTLTLEEDRLHRLTKGKLKHTIPHKQEKSTNTHRGRKKQGHYAHRGEKETRGEAESPGGQRSRSKLLQDISQRH